MVQLKYIANQTLSYILPSKQKTWIYFILNLCAMIVSLYGYFNTKGRLFGLIYTSVLGITLFAGIKSLEGE